MGLILEYGYRVFISRFVIGQIFKEFIVVALNINFSNGCMHSTTILLFRWKLEKISFSDVASSHTVGQDQACINQGAGHPNLADPNNTRGGRFRKQPRNTAPPGRAQPDARGEGAKVAARNGFSAAAAAVAKDGGQGELKPEGGAQKRAQQGGGATANSRGKARPGQNPHAENNFSKSSNLVNGQ